MVHYTSVDVFYTPTLYYTWLFCLVLSLPQKWLFSKGEGDDQIREVSKQEGHYYICE